MYVIALKDFSKKKKSKEKKIFLFEKCITFSFCFYSKWYLKR